MAKIGEVTWTGKSGKAYDYGVYLMPVDFEPEQKGNYIYCRIEAGQRWIPVYIGEGDLKKRGDVANHHQGECIKGKGATHFHAHLNAVVEDREAEEEDLLAAYPVAYKPNGCNEKEGG